MKNKQMNKILNHEKTNEIFLKKRMRKLKKLLKNRGKF